MQLSPKAEARLKLLNLGRMGGTPMQWVPIQLRILRGPPVQGGTGPHASGGPPGRRREALLSLIADLKTRFARAPATMEVVKS